MENFNNSQMLKLSFIATLLIAPLLSPSLRPAYIYFVVNLLIIVLGAEAGLLSFFSKATDDKKHAVVIAQKPVVASEVSPVKGDVVNTTIGTATLEYNQNKAKVVEKCSSEKIVGVVTVHKVKKCPSTPSIFFIGGAETEAEEVIDDDDDEEEVAGISGQELFNKAETFIGNFYKQLKMQREESWKKIHGLYHKAF
ncbi:unnamed protein product [Ilex paraguariensis]